MTQVYEGSVTINPGTNFMSFILSEEFEYKKDKNLCIAVVKNGLVGNDYPALFKMFNNDDLKIQDQSLVTVHRWHIGRFLLYIWL